MKAGNRSECGTRKRWRVSAGLMFIALMLFGCSDAKAPKVYRVGILPGVDPHVSIADGFKAKMIELGYEEGKNIVYFFQKVNADPVEQRRIAEEFVKDKVDLIFALSTSAALAAKTSAQTSNIPVVFAFTTIEDNDLIKDIREPGGNITGVRYPGPDLTAKRFELLHELAPQAKRLWVAYDLHYPTSRRASEALRSAVSARGVTLIELPATRIEEIPADLDARSASTDTGIDAILIMPETYSQSPIGWTAIRKFAAKHKIPIGGNSLVQAQQGALFSYAPDLLEDGRLAALLADKILKGTPAGKIPVVTSESYLRLNYKVAKELGLTINEGVLKMANEVIR